MNIDSYTKGVLTVIAVSLFMIAVNQWTPVAHAEWQGTDRTHLRDVSNALDDITDGIKDIAREISKIKCGN